MEFVQIYLKNLQTNIIITNFLAFFWICILTVFREPAK